MEHPRDKLLKFDEATHTYTASVPLISTTTWIHTLFPAFNADSVIDKIIHKAPYNTMTREEIKQQWEEKRITASNKGTELHNAIEYYYKNNYDTKYLEPLPEFSLFRRFENDMRTSMRYRNIHGFYLDINLTEYKPYRAEWCVFDEDIGIAGTIDMIFRNNEEYIIMDWKRTPEFKFRGFEMGYPPLDNMPNTNFSHYTLQLNTYKYILENKYGIRIKKMFLVGLHPEKYQVLEVPFVNMSPLFSKKKIILSLYI